MKGESWTSPNNPTNRRKNRCRPCRRSPLKTSLRPVPVTWSLGLLTLTAAGAVAFLLIAGTMTRTMGATRSAKLQWEERKLQIEQAERDARLDPRVDAQTNPPSEVADDR